MRYDTLEKSYHEFNELNTMRLMLTIDSRLHKVYTDKVSMLI